MPESPDAVSAAGPSCNVLLVEASTADVNDLGTAVDIAVAVGARCVSNSYGGGDMGASDFVHFFDHPVVAITACGGDAANEVNAPSSIPNVVAVGGTRLTRDPSVACGWDESAWASGGCGCSAYEPKPAYQSANGLDRHCASRATAEISADADRASGLGPTGSGPRDVGAGSTPRVLAGG